MVLAVAPVLEQRLLSYVLADRREQRGRRERRPPTLDPLSIFGVDRLRASRRTCGLVKLRRRVGAKGDWQFRHCAEPRLAPSVRRLSFRGLSSGLVRPAGLVVV